MSSAHKFIQKFWLMSNKIKDIVSKKENEKNEEI